MALYLKVFRSVPLPYIHVVLKDAVEYNVMCAKNFIFLRIRSLFVSF